MGNKQTVQRQPTNSVHYCVVTVFFEGGAMVSLGEISVSHTVKQIAEIVKEKKNLIGVPNIFIGYKRDDEIVRLPEETSLGDAKTAITRVSTLTYLLNMHARLTILDFFSTLHALIVRMPARLTIFQFFSTLHTKYMPACLTIFQNFLPPSSLNYFSNNKISYY